MLRSYRSVDVEVPGIPGKVCTPFVGPNFAKRRTGRSPPILLIHGFDSSALEWRRTFPRLAEHADVYAVDVFGCAPFGALTPCNADCDG